MDIFKLSIRNCTPRLMTLAIQGTLPGFASSYGADYESLKLAMKLIPPKIKTPQECAKAFLEETFSRIQEAMNLPPAPSPRIYKRIGFKGF